MARAGAACIALLALAGLVVSCAGGDDRQATVAATPSETAAPAETRPPADLGLDPTPRGPGTPTPPAPPITPTPAPTEMPTGTPTPVAVAFEPALGGRPFDQPVEFGVYPYGEEPAYYVAEQDGTVLVFADGEEATLLDLRDQVSRRGNEEGLLSVVPDPAFGDNGHLWTYYSVDPAALGGDRRTRLSRFTADLEASPFEIDPSTELVVLEVAQPYANHNGGAIRFGPDGMLYLGLGDGGSAGDPMGNAQNRNTLLGSVIRLDVSEASAEEPYDIPVDNPLVDGEQGRPELWAWGLRNPWRMSFDPGTGALWLGDVGQNRAEEVNVIERGGNYGWNRLEGTDCYEPPEGCDRTGVTDPVVVYTHRANREVCSITGGVVYRGDAIPGLRGHYLYGDYCSGDLWALDVETRERPVRIAQGLGTITSFGVDDRGEVYVLGFGRPVLKIVPA